MMPVAAFPLSAVGFLRAVRGPARHRFGLARPLAWGAGAGAVSVLVAIVARLFAGNLHEIQDRRVYRAAQMAPDRLEAVLEDRQIRTVVNVRGFCPDFAWYRDECDVTHAANVSQEDVTLSAIRLPTPSEIRRLIDVLDRSEYPILLHCRQGVDRTGLAATAVKLLEPGVSLATASRQLSWPYGYVAYNGTQNMRRFVSLYGQWLREREFVHSPELFRHWACREYCPGPCRARVSFEPLASAEPWPAHQGRVVGMQVRNTSIDRWRFRPGTNQGIHVRYRVFDSQGRTLLVERAGLFDAVVPLGESIALKLGVPPLAPGRYGLSVDLIDVDQNAFSQFGVEPALLEFEVGSR